MQKIFKTVWDLFSLIAPTTKVGRWITAARRCESSGLEFIWVSCADVSVFHPKYLLRADGGAPYRNLIQNVVVVCNICVFSLQFCLRIRKISRSKGEPQERMTRVIVGWIGSRLMLTSVYVTEGGISWLMRYGFINPTPVQPCSATPSTVHNNF